jgi:hypothetical protein
MKPEINNLSPEQVRRLEKLAKLLDDGNLAILEHLFEIEEKIDAKVEEMKASVPDVYKILEAVQLQDGEDGEDGKDGAQGEKGDKGDKGDTGEKGEKGDPGRDGVDGINGIPGDIKDLSPEELRDSLELLQGDERLDINAVKGIDQNNEKLSGDVLNRAIGIVDQRSSFLVQRVDRHETRLATKVEGVGTQTIFVQVDEPVGAKFGDLWVAITDGPPPDPQ